mgnify:CR=1 FL=1
MPREEYKNEVIQLAHEKLTGQIIFHKFYQRMLDSIWTKYSSYYESYEKAEQLIKMYCRDRKELVQDSYKQSFENKEELEKKIKLQEDKLR